MVDNLDSTQGAVDIGYITDVEGNWDYWCRQVELCSVLRRENENAAGVGVDSLRLVDADADAGCDGGGGGQGSFFVYGGDVFDRGNGDLRIARELVLLKRRYPSRVFLIIGNRDANKLRFAAELAHDELQRPLDSVPAPFWLQPDDTPHEYLSKLAGSTRDLRSVNTRVNRLRYILQRTMGAPNAFECRRQELCILRSGVTSNSGCSAEVAASSSCPSSSSSSSSSSSCPSVSVSDEDVCASFLASVGAPHYTAEENIPCGMRACDGFGPTGAAVVLEYLRLGDLAVVLGNTLFVHGAIDARSMGFVPHVQTHWANNGGDDSDPVGREYADVNVNKWLRALDSMKSASLDEYERQPGFDAARQVRGGGGLLAMVHHQMTGGRSVAIQRFVTLEGSVCSGIDPKVSRWLRASGISRVVVGHKPVGESPALIHPRASDPGGGVEIVMADTCYSDPRSPDKRGKAISALSVVGPSLQCNCVCVDGVLRDGRGIAFASAPVHADSGQKPALGKWTSTSDVCTRGASAKLCRVAALDYGDGTLIGLSLRDGWLVRARLKGQVGEEERFLLTQNSPTPLGVANRLPYSQREVCRAELQQELAELTADEGANLYSFARLLVSAFAISVVGSALEIDEQARQSVTVALIIGWLILHLQTKRNVKVKGK